MNRSISISAVVTARGGSKSIYKKNIIKIGSQTLLHFPLKALINSKYHISSFVNTECPLIRDSASILNIPCVDRPPELAKDDTNHGDCIINAFDQIDKILGMRTDLYIILIGNTVMIDSDLIDNCIDELVKNEEASGIMTVWEAADDHPLRAMKILNSGFLDEYTPRKISTDRHSYPKAYYYDQGVWIVRSEYLRSNLGPSPWFWMGPRVIPLIRPWITGRDINGPFDVPFHELWHNLKNTPQDFYY